MRKLLILLTVMGVAGSTTLTAQADPQSDLKEFQGYFKKKFPDVPFDDYSNGVYALDKNARAEWETLMDFPPYELELENGKTLWNTPFINGKTYASCLTREPQTYPYWDNAKNELRTLELDINDCLKKNGEPVYKNLKKGDLPDVEAYFRFTHRGQRVKIDLSNPKAVAAYEKGKQFFWARRGQLNFA